MTGERLPRLVVVGAHAMDAEVMAGGLVAIHTAAGGEAWLLHLSRGEGSYTGKTSAEAASQLDAEMAEAARLLGAGVRWLGFRSGPIPLSDAKAAIQTALADLAPEVVVTHWRGSWHPRHVITHQATLLALQAVSGVRELLFGENCEDLDGFRPTSYFDIIGGVERWFQALSSYELYRTSISLDGSGIPYHSYYRAAARNRGFESGVLAAQAFMDSIRVRRALTHLPPNFISGQAIDHPYQNS